MADRTAARTAEASSAGVTRSGYWRANHVTEVCGARQSQESARQLGDLDGNTKRLRCAARVDPLQRWDGCVVAATRDGHVVRPDGTLVPRVVRRPTAEPALDPS